MKNVHWLFWGCIIFVMAFNSWISYERIKSNKELYGELKAFSKVLEALK